VKVEGQLKKGGRRRREAHLVVGGKLDVIENDKGTCEEWRVSVGGSIAGCSAKIASPHRCVLLLPRRHL
jgi:hypothetical protein